MEDPLSVVVVAICSEAVLVVVGAFELAGGGPPVLIEGRDEVVVAMAPG